MTPNDHDFKQLTGKFDQAMTPDDAFRQKMARMLSQEAQTQPQQRSTVLASPPRADAPAPPPNRRPLTVAMSIVAVIAITFVTVWQVLPQAGESRFAAQPVPTLPADASATPGPDTQLQAEFLVSMDSQQPVRHFGDVLVSTWYSFEENTIIAYDTATGQQLWERSGRTDIVAGDDQYLYGFVGLPDLEGTPEITMSDSGNPGSIKLAAIDLTSGKDVWQVDLKFQPGEWWNSPIIIDDQVIIVTGLGLRGLDAQTGELSWTLPLDPVNLGGEGEARYLMPGITTWNGNVVVAHLDGRLLTVNPATGEVLARATYATFEGENNHAVNVTLLSFDDGVTVAYDEFNHSGQWNIVSLDMRTGQSSWSAVFQNHFSQMTSPDGSVALMEHHFHEAPWYLKLIGRGYPTSTGFSLIWLDGRSGDTILQTDEVEAPKNGWAQSDLTDEYLCYLSDELACFDRAGTQYSVGIENVHQFWIKDGVMYALNPEGLWKVTLP